MRWLRTALAFAAVALAYFHRLDRPLLWDDEADTGVGARNALRTGLPSAFDGKNLVYFDNGTQLSRSLLSKRIPWVQYYVGALSIAVFGDSTAGLRALFALAGLLAFFPLRAAFAARRMKCPDIAAALVLLAPQTVLFQRNARYYPILILLFSCLVWLLSRDFKAKRTRRTAGTTIFVLFFFTHSFAAACAAGSLLLFCALWRKRDIPDHLLASALGFLPWFAWSRLIGPAVRPPSFPSFDAMRADLGAWLGVFGRAFRATLADLDVVGALPLILLAALVAVLCARGRRRLAALCAEPLFGFVLLAILVQAAATAAVFGTEGNGQFALIRYMPHLAAFAVAACLVAADAAVPAAPPFLAIGAFAIACNLGTLSHWIPLFGRTAPASWAGPVFAEIADPDPGAWNEVFSRLRAEPAAPPGGEAVVLVIPDWTQAMAVFYLGDRYLVPPETLVQTAAGWSLRGPDPRLRDLVGVRAYERLDSRPEWIIDSAGFFRAPPMGFEAAGSFPSRRANPRDGARPELTRHAFPGSSAVSSITLFRASR
jgi:hypothetical protein